MIFLSPILVLKTLPPGDTIFVTVRFMLFKNVITLMSFTAPTVDPEEPPITINTIMIINDAGAHDANSLGVAIFAPVVVIADTIWKITFIGAMCVISAINIPLIEMAKIRNWNCISLNIDFPFVLTIL